MELLLCDYEYQYEFFDIAREFFPTSLVDTAVIKVDYKEEGEKLNITAEINANLGVKTYNFSYDITTIETPKKRCKLGLYDALSSYFDVKLPWGSLTGIRPTKLAYDLLRKGIKMSNLSSYFKNNYRVSDEKIQLVLDILQNQKPMEYGDNFVDFYVNIPFCTTKCSYCSFISAPLDKVKNYVTPYVDALLKEIEFAKKLIADRCLYVKNVYIGGGTPTSIPANELERILASLTFPYAKEFTVEAGRPDTITKEKLDVLKKYGVTRISVNPQSFNDKVLEKIGRAHSAEDTINAYNLAREYNFDINMDFIAGLPSETLKSFKYNIDTAIQLNPENITVHTLSLKNTSEFALTNQNIFKTTTTEKMVDYAHKTLTKCGYKPYYLYRQKNQLSNLQNVGYFRDNTICRFNVESMEESTSIIACGANAISKRIYNFENRIEREANVKDIPTYITRIDEMIERKKALFSK
jgi:oxygen-independent coproporphyrinogen-3 oxidase